MAQLYNFESEKRTREQLAIRNLNIQRFTDVYDEVLAIEFPLAQKWFRNIENEEVFSNQRSHDLFHDEEAYQSFYGIILNELNITCIRKESITFKEYPEYGDVTYEIANTIFRQRYHTH